MVTPEKLAKELRDADAEVEELKASYESASRRRADLMVKAIEAGNSRRDIGATLDKSMQRVTQIVDRRQAQIARGA